MKNSHYRILDLIGEGQFGRVFVGIQRQTGELVALKEFNSQNFSTKKFLREIRILLSLEHPNIVTCQGVEHKSQVRYMVTDYCEGGTLRDLMELETELNLSYKLKLIMDILAGLNYAHSHHIIHRDLKPENILLNLIPDGWIARITDFGVAKIQTEVQDNNIGLGDTGSPAYMAPEQFYGKYSYYSDIYSVGIIFYELLLGERPFSGSPNEIMISHLNKSVIIPDTLPAKLKNILHTALQKLPQHRFSSADNMFKEIQKFSLELSQNNQKIFINITNNILTFQELASYPITDLITNLVIINNQIYQSHETKLIIFSYEEKDTYFEIKKNLIYQFPAQIVNIQSCDQDCIILTKKISNSSSPNEYSFYNCQPKPEKFLVIKSADLVFTIDLHKKWLALGQKNYSKVGFQIIKLPSLKLIQPLIDEVFPEQLITIDKHHGLALFSQHESGSDCSFLRFFTRHGTWSDSFSISILLTSVTLNNQNRNYLLGLEKSENKQDNLRVVLISIKPFKVTRIPLDINPNFVISHGDYFIIADKTGEIILLNLQGKNLGKIKINEQITAISSLSDNMIILTTWAQNQGNLKILKILPKKNLDKSQKESYDDEL